MAISSRSNASAASDFRRYRYGSAAYSVPLTASGLTLSANGAYLETRPASVPIRGKAKLAGISLGYPLIRSFHQSADLSIGVDGIDSDNALVGSVLSAEHTRAVRAAAGFADNRDKRSVSFSGSVSKGLDILSARVIAPFPIRPS